MKLLLYLAQLQILIQCCSDSHVSNIKSSSNFPFPSTKSKRISMAVFYLSLCPYSRQFFTEQLARLFPPMSDLYRYIDFDFVPCPLSQHYYGGHWQFTCLHGPEECTYNKFHICALNLMKPENYLNDLKQYVPFLICLMRTENQNEVLLKCSQRFNVPLNEIKECSYSNLGDELFYNQDRKRRNFLIPIQKFPMIIINEKKSESTSNKAIVDLVKLTCKYLRNKPIQCQSQYQNVTDESSPNLTRGTTITSNFTITTEIT